MTAEEFSVTVKLNLKIVLCNSEYIDVCASHIRWLISADLIDCRRIATVKYYRKS